MRETIIGTQATNSSAKTKYLRWSMAVVAFLAVVWIRPALAQLSLDRWMTVAQCQSTTGDSGAAAVERIRCHRNQILSVRSLNAKVQEIRGIIHSIRGTVQGEDKDVCLTLTSKKYNRVPFPVAGGLCSNDWNAWRTALDDLWNLTCNMGYTRFGNEAAPYFTKIDDRRKIYVDCFDRELSNENRSYSQNVQTHGVTSRKRLGQTWKKLETDYLKHQDQYLAFYKSHANACNETLIALSRSDAQLVERKRPSCRAEIE